MNTNRILNRELASVIAATSLAIMVMSVLQPVLPLFLTSLGIKASIMGLMFALAMIGMVFGESAGGWLADKIGVRIPLGIGTAVCVPILLAFVFTTNVPFIFTLFLLWGILRAAVFGPGRGYIGRTVPLEKRATYLAIYGASMAVCRSLGSFIGGLAAERLGYEWSFYIAAAIALTGGLLVVFGLKKIPWISPSLPATQVQTPVTGKIKAPYRSQSFLSQGTIAVLVWISTGVVAPFLPLLAVDAAGVAETEVGLLFTVSTLVGAAFMIPMGRLSDRKNKKTMMIIGLLISIGGIIAIALSKNYGTLMAAMVIQGFGFAIFNPAAVALLSETIPQHWQSTAMGIYGGCEDTGMVIGSALGGIVWDTMGPQSAFLIVGMAPMILGTLVALFLLKNKPEVSQPTI